MIKKTLMVAAFAVLAVGPAIAQSSFHEKLDRGIVALPAQDKGMFISWRLLADDSQDVTFDVIRDGEIIANNISLTSFTDNEGKTTSRYKILTRQGGKETLSDEVRPWTGLYKSVPLSKPADGETPDGKPYTYTPNDCSVGDVDGDGEYEIVLKWDPSNSHDNAHNGFTGNVYIDCYKMDGRHLWRIDLGKNIRAGAHYTQFMVYDFDMDGKAEMICKTAPGSIDSKRRYVTEAATDKQIRDINNAADYRTETGRILYGEEMLTVFNGLSGQAVHTVWYNPNRGYRLGGKAEYAGWGDMNFYGNRGERYLACVAHLGGMNEKASAVMCRGYYTRSYLWAVDFDGSKLSTRWLHASLSPSEWKVTDALGKTLSEAKNLSATAYGQGAHSIAVADVDGDGCDEITYGSAAIDHDGSLLYSTGLGHGDAQHLGDLDPDRPGLEYYMVHEAKPYGADLRDARTGEILFHETAHDDTGRGLAADIDPAHRGCEMWHISNSSVKNVKGEEIAKMLPPINFRIYWDGDLQDELLGNKGRNEGFVPMLMKWNGEKAMPLPLSNGKNLYEMGNSSSCNWSKATPNLQADIFGDWREELIFWDKNDASHLNIFTSNCPTDYRVTTLMHDHVYRMGIAWQNTTYNQPPHLGYDLQSSLSPNPLEQKKDIDTKKAKKRNRK